MSKYIDVDKLIGELKSLPEQERIKYMGIYDCINSVPTADDVRKVEHGHWHLINSDVGWNDFICSVCKSEVILDEDIIYDYCPNCGAKMDGKEDE